MDTNGGSYQSLYDSLCLVSTLCFNNVALSIKELAKKALSVACP